MERWVALAPAYPPLSGDPASAAPLLITTTLLPEVVGVAGVGEAEFAGADATAMFDHSFPRVRSTAIRRIAAYLSAGGSLAGTQRVRRHERDVRDGGDPDEARIWRQGGPLNCGEGGVGC